MKEVNSWSDITVGQYQELMLVQSENEVRRFVEQIAIILDKDPEDIRNLPIAEYTNLRKQMSFLKEDPEHTVINKFEIDGVRYGLEPDLSLISTGVFLDAEQFGQDPTVNLHQSLALIFRPIIKEEGDKYEIEPHKARGFEARAQLFKERLTIDLVLGTVLFFSLLGTRLSTISLESLTEQMMKTTVTTKTTKTRVRSKKQKL